MSLLKIFYKKPSAIKESTEAVYLLAGLGNPGREYRETRHNIGFMMIDSFAARHNIKLNKVQNKAIVGVGRVNGVRVILAKPQTYMNQSGQAIAGLVRYYKVLLENLIVGHDDVDLPFQTIRIRPAGGSAGQKGMTSIIDQLGTQKFARLRMGIGRPPGQMDAAAYVLQSFTKAEKEMLGTFLDRAVDALQCYLTEGLETAMNRFNAADKD
jgi:PTH1 family peptidyl-tRNA hydrolase